MTAHNISALGLWHGSGLRGGSQFSVALDRLIASLDTHVDDSDLKFLLAQNTVERDRVRAELRALKPQLRQTKQAVERWDKASQ